MTLITLAISLHLWHILLVRSKSQVHPAIKWRQQHKYVTHWGSSQCYCVHHTVEYYSHVFWVVYSLLFPIKLFPLINRMANFYQYSVPFSSITQSWLTLWDPMDCSTPGLPVHHQLPEFTQTHIHRVSDAIQPSHPLSSLSPLAFNLSQHQGLCKWVSFSHQVAKVLEFVVFALAPSLHSFWSYFSTGLQ